LNSCKLKLVKRKRDNPSSQAKVATMMMLGPDQSHPMKPQAKVTPRERRKRRIKKIKRTRRRKKIRVDLDQIPKRRMMRLRNAHLTNLARIKKEVSENKNQV